MKGKKHYSKGAKKYVKYNMPDSTKSKKGNPVKTGHHRKYAGKKGM